MTIKSGVGVGFALLAALFAPGLPAASAGSAATWTIVANPPLPGFNLQSVSCAGPTSCSAVGIFGVHLGSVPVAEQWDGKVWAQVDSPGSGALFSGLSAVSCIAVADCTAVGGGLVEHWDGTAWTLVAHPELGGLAAVSCDAARDCMAVGSTGGISGWKTYAEHWDGTAWTVVPSPTPPGASFSHLFAVSCTADHRCSAVGASDNTALTERWDGTKWTIVPRAVPSGATASVLDAVSCTSVTDCTAVGDYHPDPNTEKALIERWDGTAWTIAPSAGPSGPDVAGHLYSVSCTTPTDCTAVGTSPTNTASTLIEQWDGRTWTTVAGADAGPAGLRGVSCATPASCTAVGSNGVPLIEHSDTANARVTALTVTVSGSQAFGSSNPAFAITAAVPSADRLTGTLTCTAVGNPATMITPTLPAGAYTVNGASCSGLTLSGPTAANFHIGYVGATFTVTRGSATTTTAPPATTTPPPLAFTGETTNVPLTGAAGLVVLSLALLRIRRRSTHNP